MIVGSWKGGTNRRQEAGGRKGRPQLLEKQRAAKEGSRKQEPGSRNQEPALGTTGGGSRRRQEARCSPGNRKQEPGASPWNNRRG
jgi:hypothetical protein